LSRIRNHRKNKLVHANVRDLPMLSSECVEAFRELFLDAIKWYEHTQITVEEKPESENPKYSLLNDLQGKIERKQELSDKDRDLVRLLEAIVTGYNKHLLQLKGKPWIRKETVEERINDVERIMRGNYLRINLD
jgi:hypothetical protein